MPALIDEIGIDAKHSFEDNILPVEDFYDQWHEQTAVLGGVDVHLLATGNEDAIRTRVQQILHHCAPPGRIRRRLGQQHSELRAGGKLPDDGRDRD